MRALLGFGLIAALLVGCGGGGNTNDCKLAINYCNVPPLASAGVAQKVLVGNTVTLNGTASSDPNGNPITYSWAFISAPAGSKAILASQQTPLPVFTPDFAGIYVIGLTVNDGKLDSAVNTTTVTASETNLVVTQAPFIDGSTIPLRFASLAVGGSNITPQLSIGDIPLGTHRFAIVMDDETAPCQTGLGACRHWGVFNIPVAKTFIAEGENLLLQLGVVYGSNYTGTVGYLGPNSTAGHIYKLTVYALSADAPVLSYIPEYNRAKFERDFRGFILGKFTLAGLYP